MLGWLAAAFLPLLIHLWSRRHYREAPWAAMEFLLAALKQKARRIRLEQWLLVAIRTLLIAVVVLAVAEPFIERIGMPLSTGGHTLRVLILDGSFSMAYKPTDKTRFERAKELSRQIVDESPQGDAFALVLMASPPRVVVGTPALDRGEIIREIENLRLPQDGSDLPATITAVRQIVENARRENLRLDRSEAYFFTDLQRVAWAPPQSEIAADEFLKQTNELAKTTAISLIDLGQAQADNLAVTDFQAVDPLSFVGRKLHFKAELKNFGRQAIRNQTVDLLADGRRIEQQKTDIEAGATASVEFSCRFDAPGDHTLEVRAAGDALDIDNHRYLSLPVRQAIRVLCVDGRPSGLPFQGAADYIAAALAPGRTTTPDQTPVQVETISETALRDRNLSDYDCIFLCNAAQFTAGESRLLDAYLQGGGGLVFLLGDRVQPDRYNNVLGIAGQGPASGPHILPATIGQTINRPQLRLDPLDYRHPILRSMRGRGENSLLTTPVFQYFQLSLPNSSSAKTVLALANGDPLVVESPVRRGRVVLVATSAEPAWTGLPLWPSFVPLVQEITMWCVSGQQQRRNLSAGQSIDIPLSSNAPETSPSLETPIGPGRLTRSRASDAPSALTYADTFQSGIYIVRFGPPVPHNESFAINVDTAESDLTAIAPEELQTEIWPGIPYLHQTSWQDLGATAPNAPHRGEYRLPMGLLYFALGLLFLETLLSWKMSCPIGARG